MTKMKQLPIILIMLHVLSISAMVHDNRFIPLFWRPNLFIGDRQSYFAIDGMFATASSAVDAKDNEIGIPELHGSFDQGLLADAFPLIGKPNPLRSEFQGAHIPWQINGKVQAQGALFSYEQGIGSLITVGASWLFMRVNSRLNFNFTRKNISLVLGPGDVKDLDDTRRQMLLDLGITENQSGQTGFGDVDCFLRFGNVWRYTLKFRLINAGIRLGALIPTSQRMQEDSPASIPFGGDGHWGVYSTIDGLFELREDLKAGFFLRVSKRFKRVLDRRIPLKGEPRIFGATIAPVEVNPGATIVFSPYIALENVRSGLGLGIQYTLTRHFEDTWRACDPTLGEQCSDQFEQIKELSSWGSDYFTLNVFYDFGKMKQRRRIEPVVRLYWDVPALLLVARKVPKTHKVTLGISFNF